MINGRPLIVATLALLVLADPWRAPADASEAAALPRSATYFGQPPPGDTPVLFAPGIVALENRCETYACLSPDGRTFLFSVVNGAWTEGALYCSRFADGAWTKPAPAPFSRDGVIDWESCFSPDGKRLFFASNRPPSAGMDIWMVERTSNAAWSAPVRLPVPVNSASEDGTPCCVNDGSLYFKSLRQGGANGSWLWRAGLQSGAYRSCESLGDRIRTGAGETEPFMAPDQSALIFISRTRPGGQGGWDLWICFRRADGSWTAPRNLGPEINTAADEYGPRLSPDGKYLFFTREERGKSMHIYWVAAAVIDRLKLTSVATGTDDFFLRGITIAREVEANVRATGTAPGSP